VRSLPALRSVLAAVYEYPGEPWDLGHDEYDRTIYHGAGASGV
jgi:hypothetical protein